MDSTAWSAAGTFIGPLVAGVSAALLAVWFGAKRFTQEQEAHDSRHYLLETGGTALKDAVDYWLELSLRNYTIAEHLISSLTLFPRDSTFALSPDQIPPLLPTGEPHFAFEAVGPTRKLTGCPELGAVVTKAMATFYNANLSWEFNIRHPVLRFYRGEWSQVPDDAIETLRSSLRNEWENIERFRDLSELLGDAVLRGQQLRVSRVRDAERIQQDSQMRSIAQSIAALLPKERVT